MSAQSLCRIDVGRQPYFLQTSTSDDETTRFELLITDAVNSWTGTRRLGQLAKKVDIDFDDYVEQTTKALTRRNLGELSFEYQLKPEAKGSMAFSWKKVMSQENIKFQLGSVKLSVIEDSAETVQHLLIFSIENSSALQEEIQRFQRENERLSSDRMNALKRLEKCVVMHEEMEKELFSKFQVVVNDKKAKIRSLKQEVIDAKVVRQAPETDANPSSEKESSHQQTDDEHDISTDEESKPTHKKTVLSHRRGELDSSLILEEESTKEVTHLASKRRRKREVVNKQTPSKLSIPKGSSTKTERSGTPSMSRTTSSRSSKSDPDADMLLEEGL